MGAEVWLEMSANSARILERLTEYGFRALRCLADGEIVVSVYLVSSEAHIREVASSAACYYPATLRLEVLGVKADIGGAVTKHIVTFTAQAVPSSSESQQEAVNA